MMKTLLVARAVLFMAALKWRYLTRLSFYLETLIAVVDVMMPIDVAEGGHYLSSKMLLSYITFIHSYFEWWPSLSCSLLSLIPFGAVRHIYFDEPVNMILSTVMINMIYHFMNLFFIHLIITKVGMLYAETEVLRSGNNQLLDNLEEGVVIFDEKKNDIVY